MHCLTLVIQGDIIIKDQTLGVETIRIGIQDVGKTKSKIPQGKLIKDTICYYD